MMEIIGLEWRSTVSVLYHVPFNIGHLTLPLFSYYLRDWRYFQFAISMTSILLLSYYWLLPESPRWLFAVGRVEDSVTVLEKAAKLNKLPIANIRKNLEIIHAAKSEQKPAGNAFDLIRTRNMRVKTICMFYNWLACGVCFFGVSQYIGGIGGNIFKNFALGALFGLPGEYLSIYIVKRVIRFHLLTLGTISCIVLLKYLGRKKTLIVGNCVCSFSMLAIAFINPDNAEVVVTLASIALTGMYKMSSIFRAFS